MNRRVLSTLIISVGCLSVQASAWALVKSDKNIVNKNTGSAAITVDFTTPVKGDLYLAVPFNGELYFFGNDGKIFSTQIIPYTTNATFSAAKKVLDIAPDGIPPATYTLYQVVTKAGQSPLLVDNWIGGLNGLSELQLRINLPEDLPEIKPTTTPITTPTPTPTPTCIESKSSHASVINAKKDSSDDDEVSTCNPTPTPSPTQTATSAENGQSLYQAKLCSSCHGSNPGKDVNDVLDGKDSRKIQEAIQKNKGNMGNLKGKITDIEIQAIANYLKTF